MPYSAAAANAFGTLGTICWTGQLLPQLWKSYRSKSTAGLSSFLPLVWGLAGIPMGAYAIAQGLNTPLVLQPQLFGALCLGAWAQCLYYGPRAPSDPAHPSNLEPAQRRRRVGACAAAYLAVLAVVGGAEAGLVYAIRPPWERGQTGPVTAIGVLASVMIAVALLPQYAEIYRARRVSGISLPFMAVDAAGGVFNDLSLVFERGPFNTLAAITYTLVVVMDGAVLLAALILNPRAERADRERLEKEANGSGTATPATQGPEADLALDKMPRAATDDSDATAADLPQCINTQGAPRNGAGATADAKALD